MFSTEYITTDLGMTTALSAEEAIPSLKIPFALICCFRLVCVCVCVCVLVCVFLQPYTLLYIVTQNLLFLSNQFPQDEERNNYYT